MIVPCISTWYALISPHLYRPSLFDLFSGASTIPGDEELGQWLVSKQLREREFQALGIKVSVKRVFVQVGALDVCLPLFVLYSLTFSVLYSADMSHVESVGTLSLENGS